MKHWVAALTWLAENTQAEHLLLMEDDVDYCRGAARILRAGMARRPDYGLTSLYLAARFAHHHGVAAGWRSHAYDERTFGALAICFRRAGGILDLLASEDLAQCIRVSRGHPAGACSHDELVFRFFRERGWPCLTHRPSLVGHLGTSSTLGREDGPHRRGRDVRRDLECSP